MPTPLNYITSITGDCTNLGLGAIEIQLIDGVPPYSVYWSNPNLGTDFDVTTSIRTGLIPGIYQVELQDSSIPQNACYTVNFTVSSGVCISSVVSSGTNCGESNGEIIVTISNGGDLATYELYSYDYLTSTSSLITISNVNQFVGLSPGVYYVVVYDQGGCSGSTGTIIIEPSTSFDYGFYVVNDSTCTALDTGAIYITGLTGTPPYTFLWDNLEITQNITGLTLGFYSVTVTDSAGCSITKGVAITQPSGLSVVSFTNVSPTCFSANGEITVNLSGGTPPYYYQFSNGENQITFSDTYTFTGLAAGTYSVIVTDAALCVASGTTSIQTPNSFTSVSTIKSNSTCGTQNGSISVNVVGGGLSCSITLIYPDTTTNTQLSSSYLFGGLSAGTYTIVIANEGLCEYTETIEILNLSIFDYNVSTYGTICGLDNGTVVINFLNFGNYSYSIGPSSGYFLSTSANTSLTLYDFPSGVYTATITDIASNCTIQKYFNVLPSTNMSLVLDTENCVDGINGTITAIINGGTPPYTLIWTNNVFPQNGTFITGLTADNYGLTVYDSNGCSISRSATITCTKKRRSSGTPQATSTLQSSNPLTRRSSIGDGYSYNLTNVCKKTFTDTFGTKLGIGEMYYDGYYNITSGDTACELSIAEFTIEVLVGTSGFTIPFYTSFGLTDYPTETEYIDEVRNLLDTLPGLGAIIFDEKTNTFTINTNCEKDLADKIVIMSLTINYYVCCIIPPTPTPTATCEPTPTPTLTPTATP